MAKRAVSHSPAVAGGRLLPVGNTHGSFWGTKVSPLVIGLSPQVCKSIAKASKVRILHLPPRGACGPAEGQTGRLRPFVRNM